MSGQLLGLFAYCVGLIALGAVIGRRVDTSTSFFVANRELGPFLLFSTVLAANIGAGSTVGAAGLGYRDGLSAWWWVGSAGIGTIVLAVWIGPRIWRVAADRDLLTVGDFLEDRYGRSVRAFIAILLWLGTLAILAGQLIAMAEILRVVAGTPRWVGALVGGAVMTAYFAAGGLVASAWINLVQLVVLFVGFAIAVPWALAAAGGWEAVVAAAPPEPAGYLTFMEGGGSGWIYLALLGPAFIVSPGLLQKVYGAASERAIRRGLVGAGVVLMVFAFAPVLLGMIARSYAPALAHHEQALPLVLTEGLPPVFGLLGLAAVLSAEISSADAILFMLSTSLSKDLYKRFVAPEATDAQVLRVARGAAIAGGALGVGLAVVLPSV
ncbi:MAG: sodium:solute symporter family protein, partial [Gemmatimonadota bacterium]|nr:sodium:solute symporter family protein [Gemmatimonadota bacterium]